MQITNLMLDPGDDSYYDDAFLVIIDSHLTYLSNLTTTKLISLDAQLVYKHEGDLTGLLNEMNYPKKYHYPIMKINGMRSTNDLRMDKTSLVIPDLSEIDLMNSIYRTKKFTL